MFPFCLVKCSLWNSAPVYFNFLLIILYYHTHDIYIYIYIYILCSIVYQSSFIANCPEPLGIAGYVSVFLSCPVSHDIFEALSPNDMTRSRT